MQRKRISPQQLKLIEIAAAEPFGLRKEDAYRVLHGIPARHRRRRGSGATVADTIKASIHRSLSRLVALGYLAKQAHASHEGKAWLLTAAGRGLAAERGFKVVSREEAAREAEAALGAIGSRLGRKAA